MVADRKNQKALALLYLASTPLRNAANSSSVPTEFATEPTRQIFELFYSINKFVFDFCHLYLFCYNAGHHAISRQKREIQHRVISSVCHFILVTLWCGRAGGLTVTWLLRHYQNSWLDRLPNLLSSGAPLIITAYYTKADNRKQALGSNREYYSKIRVSKIIVISWMQIKASRTGNFSLICLYRQYLTPK